MTRRPRPILPALALLFLGAAATVALAWIIAFRTDGELLDTQSNAYAVRPASATTEPELIRLEVVSIFGMRGWGLTYYTVPGSKPTNDASNLIVPGPALLKGVPGYALEVLSPNACTDPWPNFPPAANGRVAIEVARVESYGWPLPALWFGSSVPRPFARPATWNDVGSVNILGARHARTGFPVRLPIRPVWSGLISDTFTFAAAAWTIAVALAWARRARRRQRGLCVRCAYDRNGLTPDTPCPECGATPRAARSVTRSLHSTSAPEVR